MTEAREGFISKSKEAKPPKQAPLFPVYETERLKVPESTRRLERMARDASLDPNAYEVNALTRRTRKARIRGVAAAGLAHLRQTPSPHERTGR